MFPKFKKISIGVMLFIFIFVSMAGSLFYVRPANAMPVEVLLDAPRVTSDVLSKVGQMLEVAVMNASINAISYFTRKLAYDMAVGLATGNKGQSPLASWKNFGSEVADAANEAGGKALEEIGKPFGLNLCQIPNPTIDLTIRIGLHMKNVDGCPPEEPNCKPKCTLSKAFDEWTDGETWASRYAGMRTPEERFNEMFQADQSDMGIYLTASQKIAMQKLEAELNAQGMRTENQGFKGVTDYISGNIKTPGQVVKEQYSALSPAEQQKASSQQIWGAFGAGVTQVIPSAMSVFLNTYLSSKLNQLLDKGMIPTPGLGGSPEKYDEGPQFGGVVAAQKLFTDYLVTTVGSVDNYDLASEFSSCPPNPGPNNCAADEGLIQAIQLANYGTKAPITIREAIDKEWLHGEWKLIPSVRLADQNEKCFSKAYCHANIKVLRKARVLPLGFEIAAAQSNPDRPWSLKQVVDGFDDCIKNTDGSIAADQSSKPFCHLIDPNWVIKLPESRCKSMTYGPFPVTDGVSERSQECVDTQSCVGYDTSGKCISYGYCTREKNVWRFSADQCDAQYTTCRAFTNADGRQVAYLYRTLDTGSCTQDTVGCTAYSLNQGNNGKWLDPAVPGVSNNYLSGIHFNKNLTASCSANSAGCSNFKFANGVSSVSVQLKKAPDYFKCYDADANSPQIDWPQTVSDLARLNPKPECKNFADVCIPEEVGCNLYTPASFSGQQIPGKFTPATVISSAIGRQRVLGWGDQCDAQCVGYAAFRENPSNFSNGQGLTYIVPPNKSNADQVKTCSSKEEGCSSFTNLSQNVGEMEKVEYFTNLRFCVKPDTAIQKNYYTYEGTQAEGYQLKVYTLVKNNDAEGSPKYFYRTTEERDAMEENCNSQTYQAGTASPDCLRFNDDQGHSFYKLLPNTIVVSNDCTPYRLNNTEMYASNVPVADCAVQKGLVEGNTCKLCFQNGEYKDGFCFYNGLPEGVVASGENSRACSAEYDTCRAYKGNAGNNVKSVFVNKFEEDATGSAFNWSVSGGNITQSTESTHANEHSISHSGSGDLFRNLGEMTAVSTGEITSWVGESYTISFWVKGTSANLTVSLENDSVSRAFGTVTVGDTWKYYKLGTVDMGGNVLNNPRLIFHTGSDAPFFIDNVELVKVQDLQYLVKKTLNVPEICDSNLEDNLPGQALGCSEYTGPKTANTGNNSYYLTNFSFLCRENAIGCTALLDTYNSDSPNTTTYNVWLPGASGTEAKISNLRGSNTTELSCRITVGETGCYLKKIEGSTRTQITSAGGVFVTSTVVVPADTSPSSPIYLVINSQGKCGTTDVGCTLAGAQTLTPSSPKYTTTTIKNNPAEYDKTLCGSEAVGCTSYSANQGSFFFKDPAVIGQKVCEWKDEETVGGIKTKGWFWKDVGTCRTIFGNAGPNCSTNDDCGFKKICVGSASGFKSCETSNDCNAGDECADMCEKTEPVPCYENYFTDGSTYNIWSYGNTSTYKNFVGACEVAQDGCATFVDHNSSDQYGLPQKYYMIQNDKFARSEKECNGQVSEREGCILLDNADWPNKMWGTKESYSASAGKDFKLVSPENANAKNDANTIVKVARDRECAEWLYCKNPQQVTDPKTGKKEYKCYGLGVCSKAQTGSVKEDTQCAVTINKPAANWMSDSDYRARDVSWSGREYTGFSLFKQFPIINLDVVHTWVNDLTKDYLLSYIDQSTQRACVDPSVENGQEGADNNLDGNRDGWCVIDGASNSGQVAYPISGVSDVFSTSFVDPKNMPEKRSCRGYPEKDSPFPAVAGSGDIKFQNANLCADPSGLNCDCSYTKVFYGKNNEKVRYFNRGDLPSYDSICNGGTYSDIQCDNSKVVSASACETAGGKCENSTCNNIQDGNEGPFHNALCLSYTSGVVPDSVSAAVCQSGGGSCLNLQGSKTVTGWQGYCVERDDRRPLPGVDLNKLVPGSDQFACLTWMPLDVTEGLEDIFMLDRSAQFMWNGPTDICLVNRPMAKENSNDNIEGGIFDDTGMNMHYSSFYTPSWDDKHFYLSTDPLPSDDIRENGNWNNQLPAQAKYRFIDSYDEHGGNAKARFYQGGASGDADWVRVQSLGISNIPPRAVAVQKNYYFIKTYEEEKDHREKWQRLSYKDVFDSGPVDKKIKRGEISRIDAYFDGEIKLNEDKEPTSWYNITPSFVSLWPDINNAAIGLAYTPDLGKTGSFSRGFVTDQPLKYNYLQYMAFGDTALESKDFFTRFNSGNRFDTGDDDIWDGADVDAQVSSGLGLRIVFDDGDDPTNIYDDNLLGAWLAIDDKLGGEANIGYFFVIHFSNGSCEMLAQISSSTAESTSKPITWRLRNDQVNMHGNDGNKAPVIFKRREFMVNQPYGLVAGGQGTPPLYVNPASAISSDPLNYDELFRSISPSWIKGGVPLTIYDSQEQSSAYNLADNGHANLFIDSTIDKSYFSMLRNMFAKVFSILKLNSAGTAYEPYGDTSPILDASSPKYATPSNGTGPYKYYVPQIASPILDYRQCAEPEKKGCGIKRLNSFAINEQDEGNIYLQGSGSVTVRFYAWADAAQMPLRRIAMDFNESGYSPVEINSESISNFKSICLPDGTEDTKKHCRFDMNIPCSKASDCQKIEGHINDVDSCVTSNEGNLRAGFGSTEPTGCKEELVQFQNTYSCDTTQVYNLRNSGQDWKNNPDLCYNPNVIGGSKGHFAEVSNIVGPCTVQVDPQYQIAPGTIVCAYRPRVQVMDNWGWCTGSCAQSIDDSGTSVVATGVIDGCYNDATPYSDPRKKENQCLRFDTLNKQDPFVYFKGNVVVIPATK